MRHTRARGEARSVGRRTGDEVVHGARGLALALRVVQQAQQVVAPQLLRQRARALVELGQRGRLRARRQQLGRHGRVAALHGPVQRRHAQHVAAVHGRAGLQQQRRHGRVAAVGRQVQRRALHLGARVARHAGAQQHGARVGVAVAGRQVQRRRAQLHRAVRLQWRVARPDQRPTSAGSAYPVRGEGRALGHEVEHLRGVPGARGQQQAAAQLHGGGGGGHARPRPAARRRRRYTLRLR